MGVMPMPVSEMAKVISHADSRRRVTEAVRTTSPLSVNLTALLSRLMMICRSPDAVGQDRHGDIGGDFVGQLEAFLVAAEGEDVKGLFDAFVQVELHPLQRHLAGFDFLKIENVVDDREQIVAARADGFDVIALDLVQR